MDFDLISSLSISFIHHHTPKPNILSFFTNPSRHALVIKIIPRILLSYYLIPSIFEEKHQIQESWIARVQFAASKYIHPSRTCARTNPNRINQYLPNSRPSLNKNMLWIYFRPLGTETRPKVLSRPWIDLTGTQGHRPWSLYLLEAYAISITN